MGTRSSTGDNGTGNRVLDALPPSRFEPLRAELDDRQVALREIIYTRGRPIEWVHFPLDAIISLVTELDDERTVELATVGREGIVGIPVLLQARYTSAHDAFAQVAGTSLRMRSKRFSALVEGDATLRRLLQRYTQALLSQLGQNLACNRFHGISARCARALLQTRDRVGKDRFALTQEFLALMLGARRGSVNAAARALQEAGLIHYTRGVITIRDRRGLEAASCGCYRVVADELDRLVPTR